MESILKFILNKRETNKIDPGINLHLSKLYFDIANRTPKSNHTQIIGQPCPQIVIIQIIDINYHSLHLSCHYHNPLHISNYVHSKTYNETCELIPMDIEILSIEISSIEVSYDLDSRTIIISTGPTSNSTHLYDVLRNY